MKEVLEGLLFLVGDDGLTLEQISNVLELNEIDTSNLLKDYENDLLLGGRGFILKKYGSIYKLVTKEEYANYYKKLAEISLSRNLSQSALETLAIIAYNEPITRLEVDELRGINSSQMIRNLIARDLVKELGKSDKPGKPTLYGITDQFLDYFGISSKEQLPALTESDSVNQKDIDLYESKYKEEQ